MVTVDGVDQEIKTTDFDITREESLALYDNGVEAAGKFISTWDFEQWKEKYRKPA